jgi:hypothetical protein
MEETGQKLEILRRLSFGKRIAEEEGEALTQYFVQTDQWNRIFRGEVDIIYGQKGSGKSAIYFLIINKTDELFDRKVFVVPAEKPSGAPAFHDIEDDPPTSEREFIDLWKLYMLSLVGRTLREFGIGGEEAKEVIHYLEDAGLLQKEPNLSRLLKDALTYVRRIGNPEAIEGQVHVDPHTGLPVGFGGKIIFRQTTTDDSNRGLRSVDDLMKLANASLRANRYTLWVLLDRLDVAFAENSDLEKNALRALFHAYLDMREYGNIVVKIFLRTDIWNRITAEGFRESSHITRTVTLSWNPANLLNLVVRRLLNNPVIIDLYSVQAEDVLSKYETQQELFYKVFPDQVDAGEKQRKTFEWILSRTWDGEKTPAPRELIHFLTSLQETEIARIERGEATLSGTQLFERAAFKEALPAVSKVRLEQTFYAEYPEHREYVEKLRGEKTQQSKESLAAIWKIPEGECLKAALALTDLGFFEKRGTNDNPIFWVPFLYRDALELVQGTAEPEA